MASLLIANPDGEPQRFEVEEGVVYRIGRGPKNDIVVDDPHLSSVHAELYFDRELGCYVIEDLGSHNGTKVNGRRIEGRVGLRDGDTLVLGILEASLLPMIAPRQLEPQPLKNVTFEGSAVGRGSVGIVPFPQADETLSVEVPRVEDFIKELIKRLDLLDDLIARYKRLALGDVVEDLDALRESFRDLLRINDVEPFSFAPETEVNIALRKRIEIVEQVKAARDINGSVLIIQTVHDGYQRSRPDGDPVVLRKAYVTTCSSSGS